MALIKCIECGKEFSDRASACPNCGCPTEVVLEELNNSTRKRDVVATYDIWGYQLSLEESDVHYIHLVKAIRGIRNQILDNVTNQYYQFKNIDGLVEGLPEFYSQILELMVSSAISMLTQNGIYDCDTDTFMNKYGSSFDLSSLMEPIITRFLEIQDFEEEAIEYREYVRQQRLHTWSGGGFGIKGALQGYFKAQLLNVGTEFLHLYSDNANHTKNMAEVAKAKKALYEDENTKNLVTNALMDVYDTCFRAVIIELEACGKLSKTLFDEAKAKRIFNNIIAMLNSKNLDFKVIKEQCLLAFQSDPAHQDLIELMIHVDESPERSDLIKYAKDFGFYELYLKNKQSALEHKYRAQIEQITDIDIATNVLFKDALEQCVSLKEEGLDVTGIFKQICDSRSKYPVSSKELVELEKWIKSTSVGLSDDEISCFEEIFANIEVDDTNAEEINELVKNFCAEFARNQKDDFYFLHDSKIDIRKQEKFEDFQVYCSIPKDAHIYMTYGRYEKGYPEVLIVLTDKGIYVYEGIMSDQIFWTWKDYANSEIEVNYYKLTLGKEHYSFYCREDLGKLFLELHREFRTYFETGESQYTYHKVQWEGVSEDLEDDDVEEIDLDFNGFVESFCKTLSKEYKTQISESDSSAFMGAGFDVFWTCNGKRSDVEEYWDRYKEYWELENDVKLYAIDASLWHDGKDEHSVLFTSKGIYIYQRYNGKQQAVSGAWIDLASMQYYLIDQGYNPHIVIGEKQYTLGDRSTKIIIKLRNELRQFAIENCREIRKQVEDVDRLTPAAAQKIWNICKSFYPGPILTEYHFFHTFLLAESDNKKKDYQIPKERPEYLADRIDLEIPEDDEVYYMFSRNVSKVHSSCKNDAGPRLGLYITNSGIYWYDRTDGCDHEEWYFFENDELQLKRNEGIYIDDKFIYLREESNFVYKVLKKIQDYIKSLDGATIIMPRLENECFGKGYEHEDWITPVLGNKSNIALYSWKDCDMADAIRDYAPEIEDVVTKINLQSHGATGGLLHLIYLKSINKGILVTKNMILCQNTGGMFAVKYECIERFELGRNESKVPCLFAYINTGKNIVKGMIEIDEESLDVDLTMWNNILKEKFPRNHKSNQEQAKGKIVEAENTDNNDKKDADTETNKEEKLCRAQEIIDYSKSGAFKADGCEKSYRMLCTCLNTNETVATILGHLNTLSQNHSECATQMVNKNLLDKITSGPVSRYLSSDENALFYKDSAIIFYGKDGILITDKAIYRIKKSGIKKVMISELEAISCIDILMGSNDCRWCFNHNRDFDLDAMGVDSAQAGIIMALIVLMYADVKPDKKIKFFNYV